MLYQCHSCTLVSDAKETAHLEKVTVRDQGVSMGELLYHLEIDTLSNRYIEHLWPKAYG